MREDSITGKYGDPTVSTVTSTGGHMVETMVYARERGRSATVIRIIEDGKVSRLAYSQTEPVVPPGLSAPRRWHNEGNISANLLKIFLLIAGAVCCAKLSLLRGMITRGGAVVPGALSRRRVEKAAISGFDKARKQKCSSEEERKSGWLADVPRLQALTVKIRSLPRASNTHSSKRPRWLWRKYSYHLSSTSSGITTIMLRSGCFCDRSKMNCTIGMMMKR